MTDTDNRHKTSGDSLIQRNRTPARLTNASLGAVVCLRIRSVYFYKQRELARHR